MSDQTDQREGDTMTDLDTIAEAIEYCRNDPVYHAAIAALDRLRADPNRLDLESVPEGWHMAAFTVRRDRAWTHGVGSAAYEALLERDGGDYESRGAGPTPAAALADAVGRIG